MLIEDIDALLDMRKQLRCTKAAGATPTKAEFDALLLDVTDIFNRLTAMAQDLQKRVLP